MTLTNQGSIHTTDHLSQRLVRAKRELSSTAMRCNVVMLIPFITSALCSGSQARAQQTAPPDFGTVSQTVQQYFATLDDYQAGDLIDRSDIEGALDQVAAAGWEVPNRAAIVELALPAKSFLLNELSTPAGKKFMRRLADDPGAYARLDRLASVGRGKTIVRDLVRDKEGDKFIEYLATTKGGKNLGHMLGGAKDGVDLNKPTGRIYTAEDLLSVLRAEYAHAAQ